MAEEVHVHDDRHVDEASSVWMTLIWIIALVVVLWALFSLFGNRSLVSPTPTSTTNQNTINVPAQTSAPAATTTVNP